MENTTHAKSTKNRRERRLCGTAFEPRALESLAGLPPVAAAATKFLRSVIWKTEWPRLLCWLYRLSRTSRFVEP